MKKKDAYEQAKAYNILNVAFLLPVMALPKDMLLRIFPKELVVQTLLSQEGQRD
ncbi:ASFV G ACD 01020 [African swine fever virus]|nr:ASFV G ACD 01020 [African swine fever virus]